MKQQITVNTDIDKIRATIEQLRFFSEYNEEIQDWLNMLPEESEMDAYFVIGMQTFIHNLDIPDEHKDIILKMYK